MTKIRCQVCGSDELHSEGAVLVVCDKCGNRTYVIPESAVESIDAPVESDAVTIRYSRRETDCPRRAFCLNDTMHPGAEPCRVCKVVKSRYEKITNDLLKAYDEREEYIAQHPELKAEFGDEVSET